VAIAAAMADAARVIASDVDRYAVVAAQMNAAINGVRIETLLDDLTAGAAPDVDVVLVGDLFYDEELARRVAGLLDRCVSGGVKVLVGDPGRKFLPRERLTLLAEYPGGDFGSGKDSDTQMNAAFAFR
jgi:predicted nicotinamide N-methyase